MRNKIRLMFNVLRRGVNLVINDKTKFCYRADTPVGPYSDVHRSSTIILLRSASTSSTLEEVLFFYAHKCNFKTKPALFGK